MLTAFSHSLNDRLLRLAFVCILLMGTAVASVTPFQSIIGIERLGFSNAAYAMVSTLGAIFSVAASVLAGVYSDQSGRYREVLTGCILAGIAAGLVMYVAPSQISFVLAHVVFFPIAATTFTQYFALASLAATANRALDRDFSLSLVRAAFAASFGLTPPIWAVLVASGVDLLSVYGFVALVNVVVFAIVLTRWPVEQFAKREAPSAINLRAGFRELSERRVMLRVALVSVIVGVNALYNILLGLLVLNNLGGSEADVGWFAGLVALVEVPIMLSVAVALRHVGKPTLILLGVVTYVFFLGGLGAAPSMEAAWWLILPGGIGAGIVLSVTVGYVQELVAHRPGAGSSLASVAHFGGTLFASGVLAGGTVVSDYAGTAWIGAALGLTAGSLLFWIDKIR